MSDTTKRPWFRFHLLTAVLMLFMASALLWLEVIPTHSQPLWGVTRQGWPWVMRYEYTLLASEEAATLAEYPPMFTWIWTNVAKDVMVYALTLVAVAFVSESILRRREARRP